MESKGEVKRTSPKIVDTERLDLIWIYGEGCLTKFVPSVQN